MKSSPLNCGLFAALLCSSFLAIFSPNQAQAETTLGLGIGFAPDYLGSNDRAAIPVPSFSLDSGIGKVRSNGLGIEVDLAPKLGGPQGLGYGLIVRYDGGRNDISKVKDSVVALAAPVNAAPEVGGFVEYGQPLGDPQNGLLGNARLSVVQGLSNGPQGTVVEASIGVIKSSGRWTFGGGLTASWASKSYQNAYFGVSPSDAAATGLSPYTAKAGLRDTGLNAFASYGVTEQVDISVFASVTKLASNAANSPFVAVRGSDIQPLVGLGVTYTFR